MTCAQPGCTLNAPRKYQFCVGHWAELSAVRRSRITATTTANGKNRIVARFLRDLRASRGVE